MADYEGSKKGTTKKSAIKDEPAAPAISATIEGSITAEHTTVARVQNMVLHEISRRFVTSLFDDIVSGGTVLDEENGCTACTGNCKGSCFGSCSGSCDGSCKGNCGGDCKGDCSGSCRGDCAGTSKGDAGAVLTLEGLIARNFDSVILPTAETIGNLLTQRGFPR